MSEKKCLYCDKLCDGSDEHILQQGFGSTLSSKEVLCSTCNGLFSKTLDELCVEKYNVLYNQLGISGKSKKGRKSGSGKTIKLKNSKDEDVVVYGDQRLGAKEKPDVDVHRDKEGNIISYDITGTNYSAIKKLIKSIEKNLAPGKKLQKDTPFITTEEPGTLSDKVSFDDFYFKGIKKSLLNFVCYYDYQLAHSHIFENSVSDVYQSALHLNELAHSHDSDFKVTKESFFPFYAADSEKLQRHADLKRDSGLAHTLIISCNRSDSSIIGVAVLFGNLIHGFLLGEGFHNKSMTFCYSHDPMSTNSDSTRIDELDTAVLSKAELIENQPHKLEKKFSESLKKMSPDMWRNSRTTVIHALMKNPFDPLDIPSDYVKNQGEEIQRAVKKFFSLGMEIGFADSFSQDKALNDEINRILDKTIHQFTNKFISKFGEEKFNEDMAEILGLNMGEVFFSAIAPLFKEIEGEETLDPSKDSKPENDYPLENIKIDKMQLSVFQLKRKYDKDKSIKLNPDFQREGVWNIRQKRELIESVLMGIPLPMIYLAENKQGNLVVIDGRQRLTTFFDFMDNKFCLKDLTILKKYENVYFDKENKENVLSTKERADIEDYQLQINVIKPPTPDRIKFDIFERVNRAGTQLNKQEMRNALYQGKATEVLKKLSGLPIFREITNNSIKKTRMKDRYVILRFIGFYLWRENLLVNDKGEKIEYKSDIDDFLAKVMEFMNAVNDQELDNISNIFAKSLNHLNLVFDHNCFRLPSKTEKKRPINMYLFEALCYFFINIDETIIINNKQKIKDESNSLKNDENSEFYSSLTRSTDSTVSVLSRFVTMHELAQKIIREAKND